MAIQVEIVGKRIHLTGWMGSNTARLCKSIPGYTAKWDKTVTPNRFICWTYPLNYSVCLELRRKFGNDLKIGPELTAWAKAERNNRAALTQIIKSISFDLPAVAAVAPRLAGAMANRTYQQVGSAFLHAAKRAIVADEPGLGKTLQIMGAVVEAGVTGPILVLAPSAAIQITWPHELANWLPEDRVYVATGNREQRQKTVDRFNDCVARRPEQRHWLLCNSEMVRAHTGQPKESKLCPQPGPRRWEHKDKRTGEISRGVWHHPYAAMFQSEWSVIIADESQRFLVTRTPNKEDQTQGRAGAGMLRIREGGMRLAASGTPFRGKKENLWGTLNWLRPEVYTSYWNWVKMHFETFEDGMSLVIGDLKPGQEDAFYAELDSVMIRRKKSEVAQELPPKQYAGAPLDPERPGSLHGIWLDMDEKQAKSYAAMVTHAAAMLDSGRLMRTGVLAEMTSLKQFASCHGDVKKKTVRDPATGEMKDVQVFVPKLPSNKFDWLVNWLDERGHMNGEGTGKVVIASQFTQIINMFADELVLLGVPVHKLTGETTARQRVKAKEEFQAEGGPRVFFLNTDAGGVSLTLDAADDLIFLDEKWVPDDQEQVEDRIHRVSRMHQVTIWYVRSLGTIEEHIGQMNEERDDMQKMLLDGRRGVEYGKLLLTGG